MRVEELGEFGLIDRLARLSPPPGGDLLVGIGDDAAAWRAGDTIILATTDTMVDGVHFLMSVAEPEKAGWKSIVSNVSDIGAMGGRPRFSLVTLGLPESTPVDWVDRVYAGMHRAAMEYGTVIVGGDVVRSPVTFLTIAQFGEAPWTADWRASLLLRTGARPGDVVAVTGTLGGARGGLELRLGRRAAPDEERRALLDVHDEPRPPKDIGPKLAALGVRAGLDLSDGLAGDLQKLCIASGVHATIDLARIPVHPALRAAWPEDARALAASGGEDYNLLFTASPSVWARIQTAGIAATGIGSISAGSPGVTYVGGEGAQPRSWDHLGAGC